MFTLDHVIAVRNRKTVYRDGDKVIKLFDETYSKADILNEACNQARIETTGIPVPKVLEVAMIEGKWAIVSEFIQGRTFAEIMAEHAGERDTCLEQFVEIQQSVLSHTCAGLNELKHKMNRKISQADIDATTRYDLHMRLNGLSQENSVCHGDFNPSNIIITDDGTPYILDWSHVTQGHRAGDAARTYLLFWLAGDVECANKYLEIFCRKTDTARQIVQKWMPIVATSQSVKGHEKEREFLLSWANVVDYE